MARPRRRACSGECSRRATSGYTDVWARTIWGSHERLVRLARVMTPTRCDAGRLCAGRQSPETASTPARPGFLRTAGLPARNM